MQMQLCRSSNLEKLGEVLLCSHAARQLGLPGLCIIGSSVPTMVLLYSYI